MSRHIDRLPTPPTARPVKVIVATPSRTGTFSLYQAMGMLGFNAYHMRNVRTAGHAHCRILTEALIAEHNRFSGIKRYGKPEFDKWFAEYDCIMEMPFFLSTSILEAYADDPSIKFILTERDPDRWVTSFNKTAGATCAKATRFPLNLLLYFHQELYWFLTLSKTIYYAISDGTLPEEDGNREAMRRNYLEYMKRAKQIIPSDQLLTFKLEENGLDWAQVCPFLGVPVPDTKFPDPLVPEKFAAAMENYLAPMIRMAMLRLSLIAAPCLGIVCWLLIKAIAYG